MRHWGKLAAGLVLLAGLSAVGCQDQPPTETRPNPGFWMQGSSSLSIAEVAFEAQHVVGDERWQASFRIPEAGSQQIAKVGLKADGVEKLTEVKPLLPIINGGKVTMWVGPMPEPKKAGTFTVEFWIVDDQGHASNRLTQQMTVQ